MRLFMRALVLILYTFRIFEKTFYQYQLQKEPTHFSLRTYSDLRFFWYSQSEADLITLYKSFFDVTSKLNAHFCLGSYKTLLFQVFLILRSAYHTERVVDIQGFCIDSE